MVSMGRPLVMVAGLLAFMAGACMSLWSIGQLPWASVISSLAIMVLAILMGHYANEYADFDTDSITRRTRFSGGSGVLPSGIVPRAWALYAALACLALTISAVVLCYAARVIGAQVVALVAAGLPLGWFYSMPPLRLERTWAGELVNSFLGYLMLLMGYVPAAGFDALALVMGVPVFLAILINLLGVHHPDMEADRAVGKMTMAVALGQGTKRVFVVLTVVMCLSLPLVYPFVPLAAMVCMLLVVPVAGWAARGFWRTGGPQYGSMLMAALFLAISLGFLLSHFFPWQVP
jgi:1,4-dihydroxy-2-naphthoate octaprenyltransferase